MDASWPCDLHSWQVTRDFGRVKGLKCRCHPLHAGNKAWYYILDANDWMSLKSIPVWSAAKNLARVRDNLGLGWG